MAKVRITISTMDGEVLDTFAATDSKSDCHTDDIVYMGGPFAGSTLANAVTCSLSIIEARRDREDVFKAERECQHSIGVRSDD